MSMSAEPEGSSCVSSPASGWTEVPLRSVLQLLETGHRPKGGVRAIKKGVPSVGGEHLNDRGGFNFDNVKYVPDEFFASMRRGHVRENDILVVKDGATTGKVSLIRADFPFSTAVINEHVFCCRTREGTDPRFLFWYLWSEQGQQRILEHFQGSAQGGINQSFADNTLVPITSFGEQRRIVHAIEQSAARVDAARDRLANVPAILKRFRQSVLTAACSGRLTEDWRCRHPDGPTASVELQQAIAERHKRGSMKQGRGKHVEPEAADRGSLESLPENWAWATFDQCAWEITVGHVGPMKHQYVAHGIPFLRSQNVRPMRFEHEGVVRIPEPFHKALSKSRLVGGELLVTRSGANTGQCCVYPPDADEANCSDLVITRLLPILNPFYACLYVNSPLAQARLNDGETGIAQPHFNIGAMRIKPVPLPPTAEQAEIVRRVESLLKLADAIERRVALAQTRADRLTQSILAKAFRGELVRTGINDETATSQPLARPVVWRFEDFAAVQAEIVLRFPNDPTLGRKKLFKLSYLAAALANAKTERPLKQDAAGPYDGKLQSDAEAHAASQKWFTANTTSRDPGEAHYRKGSRSAEATATSKSLLGERWTGFQTLLAAAKSWDSTAAELHATTHAAWNSLLAEGTEASPEAITARFFAWSPEKSKRFTKWNVDSARQTLTKLGLVPTGRCLVVEGLGQPGLFTSSNL